jgi:hypothetical protein
MAIETQGTTLYTIDPDTETLIEVGCVTSIDGIDTSIEQIETTCLEDTARTYVSGLATPGAATFGINFDPSDTTHVRLHELKTAGTTLVWALGMSDGTADPTVDSGGTFDLATSRSWIRFDGFMSSFPFSFQQNSVVQSTVGIQISGDPQLFEKA